MQTPDSSPVQQRKRQSPISNLTRKSWNNLRSRLGNKAQTSSTNKSEFLLISADVPQRRQSIPLITIEDPPEEREEEASKDGLPDPPGEAAVSLDSDAESPSKMRLGEPFYEDRDTSVTTDESSDTMSQFSFERKPSCHYYKPSEPEESLRALSLFQKDCSPSSYDESFENNIDDLEYGELYGGGDFDAYDVDSLSDLDDSSFAELIAEANLIPNEDDTREQLLRQPSTSSSIHRQLSQITRDDLVVTFFDEVRPKRTKSTLSTTSTVWPIKE